MSFVGSKIIGEFEPSNTLFCLNIDKNFDNLPHIVMFIVFLRDLFNKTLYHYFNKSSKLSTKKWAKQADIV